MREIKENVSFYWSWALEICFTHDLLEVGGYALGYTPQRRSNTSHQIIIILNKVILL